MRILHATTTNLSQREFNNLSDKIIDALYGLTPNVRGLYDIHLNYIKDSWVIDFLPIMDYIPVIKVQTSTIQDDNGGEVLKVTPANLTDIPGILKFKGDPTDLCNDYIYVFEIVLALQNFEYRLS